MWNMFPLSKFIEPRISSACALPGRIEVGQWGLKNFGGEWWSPWSGGTVMNVGDLLSCWCRMWCCIIPTDQAAALVTIGEIYSMNGKKDEAKKVQMNILPWPAEHVTMSAAHAWLVNCEELFEPFTSFHLFQVCHEIDYNFYRLPGTVTRAVCSQVSGHRSEDPRSSEWRCCIVPCLVCSVLGRQCIGRNILEIIFDRY